MGKQDNKLIRRRLANAYTSSVISISLVLLLVGVAAMLLLNARTISKYFKENMEIAVIMKQTVSEEEALGFLEKLGNERYVKTTTFVSREQGEAEMMELLGEDFLDVFEASPIPVSIDMTLLKDFIFDIREIEINRNYSILPGHLFVWYLRIMIPVSLNCNRII